MDRNDNDAHRGTKAETASGPPDETHRRCVLLARHLEQVLHLYDELDEGDSNRAAHAQSALDDVKRRLRTQYGPASPPAPLPQAQILLFPAPAAATVRHRGLDDE